MRYVLTLLLFGMTACHFVDLTGLCLSSRGCQKGGNGNGITFFWDQVTINRGGVLAPDTVRTQVGPTVTQQPAINWVNHDSLTHHFVSDSARFDTGDITPGGGGWAELNRVGTFPYHCVNHAWMVGTIVVP